MAELSNNGQHRFVAMASAVAQSTVLSNNGMQLTKAARCAPFSFRSLGQSLRAAFAADPGCWTDAAAYDLSQRRLVE